MKNSSTEFEPNKLSACDVLHLLKTVGPDFFCNTHVIQTVTKACPAVYLLGETRARIKCHTLFERRIKSAETACLNGLVLHPSRRFSFIEKHEHTEEWNKTANSSLRKK